VHFRYSHWTYTMGKDATKRRREKHEEKRRFPLTFEHEDIVLVDGKDYGVVIGLPEPAGAAEPQQQPRVPQGQVRVRMHPGGEAVNLPVGHAAGRVALHKLGAEGEAAKAVRTAAKTAKKKAAKKEKKSSAAKKSGDGAQPKPGSAAAKRAAQQAGEREAFEERRSHVAAANNYDLKAAPGAAYAARRAKFPASCLLLPIKLIIGLVTCSLKRPRLMIEFCCGRGLLGATVAAMYDTFVCTVDLDPGVDPDYAMSAADFIKTGVLSRLAATFEIWCIFMAVPCESGSGVCHQYLLPDLPVHLARRLANQQACIVALADAYEFLKPMFPNLIVALECPERNRAFCNANYLNLRYMAKMHEVDYSHLAFGCDYDKKGVFSCSGLAAVWRPENTTATQSAGPGLKQRKANALRDAAVYNEEVSQFFSKMLVKSKQLVDQGFGADYRKYKAHFDEHYNVKHARADRDFDPEFY